MKPLEAKPAVEELGRDRPEHVAGLRVHLLGCGRRLVVPSYDVEAKLAAACGHPYAEVELDRAPKAIESDVSVGRHEPD